MFCPAKAYRVCMFVIRLSHRAIVESKLFTICNVLYRIHANYVLAIWYCWNGAAIWGTWMWKSTWKVAFLNRVYYQHVISQWFILMLLQVNVVKLWYHIFQFFLLQNLLNKVFPLVPSPRLIQLPKIFHDKGSSLDTFLSNAFSSFPLCMNSEELIVWELSACIYYITE